MKLRSIVSIGVIAAILFSLPITSLNALTLESSPAFYYTFNNWEGNLQETTSSSASPSPYWWLRKGARLFVTGGVGKTVQGNLPQNDPYRFLYSQYSPTESDGGYHPQNIFRLISKSSWTNFQEQITVTPKTHNLANSVNRHEWNGISLLSRYQDENNYYYGSIRADGKAVIKKKKSGSYYTLSSGPFFSGTYNANTNPSLIPLNSTMGLKLQTYTNSNNSVTIKFFIDRYNNGNWTLATEATDNGSTGGQPILSGGRGGIYSDYMDLEMDDYKVTLFTEGGSSSTPTISTSTPTIKPTSTSSTPTPPPPPPPPQIAHVNVITHVINDNGGIKEASDVSMHVTGSNPTPANFSGEETPGVLVDLGPSSYSVTADSVSGYTMSSSSACSGTISSGQTKTCTVTLNDVAPTPPPQPPPPPPPAGTYGLNLDAEIEEAGSPSQSSSPYWWVNSGGYFNVQSGIGKTVQGELPSNDFWRLAYASANPLDTDNGYHPQNIFRLITKSNWTNFTQEGYFEVNEINLSSSPNRDGHNGFLFFNRYVDGQNLYYTGLRVDGKAIIKKKKNGTYTTLSSNQVFPGTYNRNSNPNLLPLNTKIGLRSVVQTNSNGSVNIKVYMDNGHTGNWVLIAEATDSSNPITSGASAGIRTDFMDAEITEYKLTEN